MRCGSILFTLPLLALAACHADIDIGDKDDVGSNVQLAVKDGGGDNKVSIEVPGFSAKVALPNLNLGEHLDLDGIAVAQGTKVSSLDVTANEGDKGNDRGLVRASFTNPGAPAKIIDHYARSAADAGYRSIARNADTLTATKGSKTFSVQVSPDGSGSKGSITITGRG